MSACVKVMTRPFHVWQETLAVSVERHPILALSAGAVVVGALLVAAVAAITLAVMLPMCWFSALLG